MAQDGRQAARDSADRFITEGRKAARAFNDETCEPREVIRLWLYAFERRLPEDTSGLDLAPIEADILTYRSRRHQRDHSLFDFFMDLSRKLLVLKDRCSPCE